MCVILHLYIVAIPIIPKPAKYAAGRVGEDITISCIPDDTGIVINWQKDTVPITADESKYTFSPTGIDHMLTIKSITKSDSGSYTCSAAGTTIAIEVIVINGMYVCMYACMYVCMYVCIYVCTYVRMYVCMYICMYVCMNVCMYVCNSCNMGMRVYISSKA